MFAYILRASLAPNEQTDDFFRRFKEQPGLLHSYSMQGADDPSDSVVIAIWESREAAERYLKSAPLRSEVDQAVRVTRTLYTVRDSK